MTDDRQLAETVLALVGGPENVSDVTACWSRLRLVLRDDTLHDDPALTALDEVAMVLTRAGSSRSCWAPARSRSASRSAPC